MFFCCCFMILAEEVVDIFKLYIFLFFVHKPKSMRVHTKAKRYQDNKEEKEDAEKEEKETVDQ